MQQTIPTGFKTIDEHLGGGFASGSINLVYGEAETGKTSLAMQCTVNCANQGRKTLFVDCDNTFSIQRLRQIASKQFAQTSELIILARPRDFREQAALIDQLGEYTAHNFGLAVIDTLTTLYRLSVSESQSRTFELNRELNRQLAILAQTAKNNKIAVLVISQVHSAVDAVPIRAEPVATRVLKFWANTIIELRPTENPQVVEMTLEKSPITPQPRTRNLIIEEAGMREYPGR